MAVVSNTFASAGVICLELPFMTNIQPLEVLSKALVSRPREKHTVLKNEEISVSVCQLTLTVEVKCSVEGLSEEECSTP